MSSPKEKFKICRCCLSGIVDIESAVSIVSEEIQEMHPKVLKSFLFVEDPATPDAHPKSICSMCYENLFIVNDFYKICAESQQLLTTLTPQQTEVEKPKENPRKKVKLEGLEEYLVINSSSTNTSKERSAEVDDPFENNDDLSDDPKASAVHKSRSHICKTCDQSFRHDFNLKTHMKSHNPNYCPYYCKICGKGLETHSAYLAHLTEHSGHHPYYCEVCGDGFESKALLSSHLEKHDGENTVNAIKVESFAPAVVADRKFKCNYCSMSFKKSSHQKSHEKTLHFKEKPHVCEICKRGFARIGDKKIHLLRHKGVKNFTCEYCHKGFVRNNALQAHLRTHTGGVPFSCKFCEESFKSYYAMRRHTALTHSESDCRESVEPEYVELENDPFAEDDTQDSEEDNEQ